MDRRENS